MYQYVVRCTMYYVHTTYSMKFAYHISPGKNFGREEHLALQYIVLFLVLGNMLQQQQQYSNATSVACLRADKASSSTQAGCRTNGNRPSNSNHWAKTILLRRSGGTSFFSRLDREERSSVRCRKKFFSFLDAFTAAAQSKEHTV